MSIDDDVNNGIKKLSKALEAEMFAPNTTLKVKYDLKRLLDKLGIKSAKANLWADMILQMEGLEATLRQVKFDSKDLKKLKK